MRRWRSTPAIRPGRAEPGDLSAIATLMRDLFFELATESLTVEGLQQRGGILRERHAGPELGSGEASGNGSQAIGVAKPAS